ncbi:MAG: FecR family protein [Chloroflexota bacterium]
MKGSPVKIVLILLLLAAFSGCTNTTSGANLDLPPTQPDLDDFAADPTLTPPNESANLELTALLSESKGEILAMQPGQSEFSYVEAGYLLQSMGQMSTGKDASAKLDLSDGAIVRLGGNTSFTLVDSQPQADDWITRVRLQLGELWVILQGGSLEVDTIAGTASVRGSYLSVSVDLDGRLYITCLEGDCALFNAGGRVDLYAGQSAFVEHVTALPIMGVMAQTDVDDWVKNFPETVGMMDAMAATAQAYDELITGDPDEDGYQGAEDLCPLRGDQGFGVDQFGCPNLSPDGDNDHDGINNADDLCPFLGDLGGGVDANGCPTAPLDTDGDGYPDAGDLCPEQGDLGDGLDALGCPLPGDVEDQDGDGVPDELDLCPDQAGDLDNNGCPGTEPAADRDGDGVSDDLDQCPDEPGSVIYGGCPEPPPEPPPSLPEPPPPSEPLPPPPEATPDLDLP